MSHKATVVDVNGEIWFHTEDTSGNAVFFDELHVNGDMEDGYILVAAANDEGSARARIRYSQTREVHYVELGDEFTKASHRIGVIKASDFALGTEITLSMPGHPEDFSLAQYLEKKANGGEPIAQLGAPKLRFASSAVGA